LAKLKKTAEVAQMKVKNDPAALGLSENFRKIEKTDTHFSRVLSGASER